MSKNKGKKKSTSIYLWKIVLIILALFVVFISIECFLLIERTAQKIILGFSKGLGTSIIAETEESASSETIEEVQNSNPENVENTEPSTDLNNGEPIIEETENKVQTEDKETVEDNKEIEDKEPSKEEAENKDLDKDESKNDGKEPNESETLNENEEMTGSEIETEDKETTKNDEDIPDIVEIMSDENEDEILIDDEPQPLAENTNFELGDIPSKWYVKDYNVKGINILKRKSGGAIIIYNNTNKEDVTVGDLNLEKTLSQEDKNYGLAGVKFKNFVAVVAQKYTNYGGQNNFRVIETIQPGVMYNNEESKYNITIPEDGIVIFFHDVDVETLDGSKTGLNIEENDIIHVNFDYKANSGFEANGYGDFSVYRKIFENPENIPGNLVNSYNVNAINKAKENIRGVTIFYNNKGKGAIQVKDVDYDKSEQNANNIFRFYAAIIAEKADIGEDENNYRVTWMYGRNDFYKDDFTKTNLTIPEDGIIIFIHDNDLYNLGESQNYMPNIKLNDIIHVNFNYMAKKIDKKYDSGSFGEILVYRDESTYSTVQTGYPVTEINYARNNALGASIVYNNTNNENVQVKDIDINFESSSTHKFRYFSAIVAEKLEGQERKFKIAQIITRDQKDDVDVLKTHITIPKDGIVIYFHSEDINRFDGDLTTPSLSVGDILEVDFDYTQISQGYNPDAYGNIKLNLKKDNAYYEIHHINNLSNDSYAQKRTNNNI